jgi:glycosyltransferase involved in cell wall biosynthesis
MKIVIAVHHYPPIYTAGAEGEAHRTALALQARGHQVQVICVEKIDSGKDEGVTFEDTVYENIPVRRISYNHLLEPDKFKWEYDNLWIGEHLKGFLDIIRPDIFHLRSGYLMSGRALRVAKELHIPTVLSVTDFWFFCPRITMMQSNGKISTFPIEPFRCARCLGEGKRRYRIPGKIAPVIMSWYWGLQTKKIQQIKERKSFLLNALDGVNVIISPSQYLRSFFLQEGVDAEKVVFCRQGRDFTNLSPEKLIKSSSKRLRLGYFGQIAWHKGIHLLFEALRSLPSAPVDVAIYGDTSSFPDYTSKLKQLAAEDPRLTFKGVFRGENKLWQIYRDIDALVVPSIWYENSPNVIIEAFAHKTPVITSDQGGMAEMVRDGVDGLYFKHGDSQDLVSQIQKLLDMPSRLSDLQKGIQAVKPAVQEIDELISIYQRVLPK